LRALDQHGAAFQLVAIRGQRRRILIHVGVRKCVGVTPRRKSNQKMESCVNTLPLSGMPVGRM
jgi:transposase InsO family protein